MYSQGQSCQTEPWEHSNGFQQEGVREGAKVGVRGGVERSGGLALILVGGTNAPRSTVAASFNRRRTCRSSTKQAAGCQSNDS